MYNILTWPTWILMISLILLKKCVLFCSRVTIELKKKDEKEEKKRPGKMCFVALKKRSNVFHYLLNSLYPLYRNSSLLCQHGGFISLVHTVLFFFKEEEYPKSNGASVHIPFMTTRPDLAYIRIELQITVKSQSRHISNFLLILILHTRQRDIY